MTFRDAVLEDKHGRMAGARNARAVVAAIVALIGLTGCSKPEPPVLLHKTMAEVVAPQAQILWDTAGRGVNDAGEPDGTKLTEADWAKLIDAAQRVKGAATRLEDAKAVKVVNAGEKIQDEGQPDASTGGAVQQLIDKDMPGFSKHANKLEKSADDFLTAATERDARKLFDASNGLDQVCEACHLDFWYPQEKPRK